MIIYNPMTNLCKVFNLFEQDSRLSGVTYVGIKIMKMLIICSGKPAVTWKNLYNSADFDEACRHAVDGDIEKAASERISSGDRPVYVSSEKGTFHTAELLFTDADIIEEPLLDEVPQRPYKDTKKELPLWRWQLMASIQRFFGNKRQPESRAQAKARAKKLLDLLESRNQDCILISHPNFIRVVLDCLSSRGYYITRQNLFRIAPLERIAITRRDMHCGGCGHNCLLSNPGCGVGRDAARRKNGIK